MCVSSCCYPCIQDRCDLAVYTASRLTPTFGLPAPSIILTDLLGSRDREEACVCSYMHACTSLLKNMWFYLQKSDFIPGFLTHTCTHTCTWTPRLWCKIRGSSGASQVRWEEEVERGEMKRKKKERRSLLKQGCCFNNPRALHLLWPSISLSFSASLSLFFYTLKQPCWCGLITAGGGGRSSSDHKKCYDSCFSWTFFDCLTGVDSHHKKNTPTHTFPTLL